MKNIFKPEDFNGLGYDECRTSARQANEKLSALIESWPVVTGVMIMNDKIVGVPFGQVNGADDTHQARLAFISPIEREECKHEATVVQYKHGHPDYPLKAKCTHCGVELIAEWKVKP